MGIPPPDGDQPDLLGVIAAANHVGLPYVIIGGFAVIANQYVRGTEDVDLLIEEDRTLDATVLEFLKSIDAHRNGQPITAGVLHTAETLRVASRLGPVDLLRGGAPPLDFKTVSDAAIKLVYHDQPARVASLASLVMLKRVADRPRDRLDLIELERIHGPLPVQQVPSLGN
jgi:hypothetical protein